MECPKCGEDMYVRRFGNSAAIHSKDFSQINANNPEAPVGVYTQLGVDAKGDWRRPVRTKADVIKLHDDWNIAHADEGRRVVPHFGDSFGSSQNVRPD